MRSFDLEAADKPAESSFDSEIGETTTWLASPRFEGITRLYSARQVVEQRGTIPTDYTVARLAAEQFYDRLLGVLRKKDAFTRNPFCWITNPGDVADPENTKPVVPDFAPFGTVATRLGHV